MTLVNYGKLIFQEKPTFLCEILKIDAPKDLENSKISKNLYAHLPKLNTNQLQNIFCYQGPKLWNLLKSSAVICDKITDLLNINRRGQY